jgi:hypothetical protein
MPEMRNDNAPTVLDAYLYCESRHNKPRLHHTICENNCRKCKKCPYYSKWYANNYGKDVEKAEKVEKEESKPERKVPVRRTRKKINKKKSKTKVVNK